MSFFAIFKITVLGGAKESMPISAAPPDTQHTNNVPAGRKRAWFNWVMEWNKRELFCFLLPSVSHTSSGKPFSLPRQPWRNTKSRTIPCVREASYSLVHAFAWMSRETLPSTSTQVSPGKVVGDVCKIIMTCIYRLSFVLMAAKAWGPALRAWAMLFLQCSVTWSWPDSIQEDSWGLLWK